MAVHMFSLTLLHYFVHVRMRGTMERGFGFEAIAYLTLSMWERVDSHGLRCLKRLLRPEIMIDHKFYDNTIFNVEYPDMVVLVRIDIDKMAEIISFFVF